MYATTAELDALALPPDVAGKADVTEKEAALEAASALADSYLRQAGYVVPITTPGDDLKNAVCEIAAYNLAVSKNLAPEGGEVSNLYLRKREAIRWLERVAAGKARLEGQDASGGEAYIVTDPKRGW